MRPGITSTAITKRCAKISDDMVRREIERLEMVAGQCEGATRDEAERALVIARGMFEAVVARLPEDARP